MTDELLLPLRALTAFQEFHTPYDDDHVNDTAKKKLLIVSALTQSLLVSFTLTIHLHHSFPSLPHNMLLRITDTLHYRRPNAPSCTCSGWNKKT